MKNKFTTMSKTKILLYFLSFFILVPTFAQENKISLAGKWNFSLDKEDRGIKESWQNRKLNQTISLPGTTDEAQYGEKTTGSDFGILTRAYKHYGPAWYQKTIDIPADWKGKRIFLHLERVMWESKIFLDGKEISSYDALSSRHLHNLGYLSTGKHELSIRINNDLIHNIGDKGHVYSEYTQSIWNGVVGDIELIAKSEIRLDNPQVFTYISPRSFTVKDTIINESKKSQDIELSYSLYDRETKKEVFTQSEKMKVSSGKTPLNFSAKLEQSIKLWDDINPNLYELKISVLDKKSEKLDTQSIELGFREITTSKSKILVNGRPVFFRGNLDCVHFPLTGYPSCDVEEWERIFRIYKDYGLNHVRFHSWCPPEAAFTAANRIGIYLQPETVWLDWWMAINEPGREEMHTKGNPDGLGKNPSADAFIQKELARMFDRYSNHPSFATMSIGNELGNSDFDIMESWLKPYKEKDKRHLYSVSSARKIMPLDDFMATHYIQDMGGTRGLRGGAKTDWDFEDVYSQSNIPIIAHEIGQWPVYPRWSEIKKYKGVLKARNFEEFREQARKNKIEHQNEEFVMASGALNQIMYKYEIESFLRTPSCAGIQLLSMQDYQGQGEALIGWLDVFYDSKGITTPERVRNHQDTTVLLLRLPKFVWKTEEQLTATVQLAHYGEADIKDEIEWKIKDEYSNVIAQGKLGERIFEQGTSDQIAKISTPLNKITKATKLNIELSLASRAIQNSWDIWVYPEVEIQKPKDILITNRFDKEAQQYLRKGGSVLLDASELGKDKTADPIGFYPLYWSLTFFPGQGTNTIGMIVRDNHPALMDFPTDKHSNWQWQSIYQGAKGFHINDFPESYKPIAQPVDDFHRNNKLATIFELNVGKGKLLVSGFNISKEDNIVAKQLKHSLLNYMQSSRFKPEYQKSEEALTEMFSYIEPLKSIVPVEFSNALLYVEAGAKLKKSSKEWNQAYDKFESRKNTNYEVSADGMWIDDVSTAWHGKEIDVRIKTPAGAIGSLYVFFHDWNNQGRSGDVVFEGRDFVIGKHDKDGMWVKLHVMREDTNDGEINLKAKVKQGGNLMISKIAFVEE